MSNPTESQDEKGDQVDAAIAEFLEAIDRGTALNRELWLERHAEVRRELLDFLSSERDLGLASQKVQPNNQNNLK